MAIDREELNHLEDSLVHDADEEPQPQGWGIYATPKFLARTTLIAYVVMVALVLMAGAFYPGTRLPVFLMPGSLFVALTFVVVALYLEIVGAPEPALARQRTLPGRLLTGLLSYIVLQVLTTGLWIGIAVAFKLR